MTFLTGSAEGDKALGMMLFYYIAGTVTFFVAFSFLCDGVKFFLKRRR